MDIVLIRHPAVALEAGVCYGHSDVALAEDAEVSSDALALKLATLQVPAPRVLMSSPLTRCSALATELANAFGCVISHDDRLKEMDFGAWETQRWDAIDRELLDAWAANFEHARAHGGESVAQFVARVRAWLDAFAQTRELSPAYVVTHAGVMRVIASLVLDVQLERCLRWSLDMTGVVWLRRDDETQQWSLVRWNA
ncbi:alpha-ribazole phosphatase [Paraburkholderia bryophila]|jgi:alpha-ribazole phosphatase|uniref:Alpha-ribazole phosphatase n=1 Tax=Paraburkholderia bryophila TaxID=420952 RepID=A0A329CW89_9BURK|nr:alpha-ribazole phosphatase [Paraburkholderia bryophila]RAS36014.1 alpha-ribazole phosphatase [Paraburkholderia bryophila]